MAIIEIFQKINLPESKSPIEYTVNEKGTK